MCARNTASDRVHRFSRVPERVRRLVFLYYRLAPPFIVTLATVARRGEFGGVLFRRLATMRTMTTLCGLRRGF